VNAVATGTPKSNEGADVGPTPKEREGVAVTPKEGKVNPGEGAVVVAVLDGAAPARGIPVVENVNDGREFPVN